MSSLKRMYPSLTTFSDLDWDLVTAEYETNYHDLSFPEYLQQKASEGDCPDYLFELAYYELGRFEVETAQTPLPQSPGVHLNPTALFLSLEYDVVGMIEEARAGKIGIIEYPHCLCIYKNRKNEIKTIALEEDDLKRLQQLENGPIESPQGFNDLIREDIVISL